MATFPQGAVEGKGNLMRSIAGMVILSILLFFSHARGQIHSGMNELNISGSLNNSKVDGGETYTYIHLSSGFGHFFNEFLEAGANFSLEKAEDMDPCGTASLFISIHFPSATLRTAVPYLGGQIGGGYGSEDNPFIWGAFAGLKLFVSGGGAVTIQPYYVKQQYPSDVNIDNYGLLTGVSIFF
jgi:hypothetical protein